ncbi:hypothetical protein Dda_1102 [Drechslerella dactyloides]|uniref:Uncharacterized protein n=1 Tax=Drechslerella dactyloides TaxID=74499 RepID=A0AAD6J788_DREDA|nr:hypothetical protein Dda_1102 [Drechslerella dactyloides]
MEAPFANDDTRTYAAKFIEKAISHRQGKIQRTHVCNADLSQPAIEAILKTTLTGLKSVTLDDLSVRKAYCCLIYIFKTNDPGRRGALIIKQCESEPEAEAWFAGSLMGLSTTRETWPKPLQDPPLGYMAVRGGSGVGFVRDTIYIEIFSEGIPDAEMFAVARALDAHFAAAKGEYERKKVLPECILRTSERISVLRGTEFALENKPNEDHFNCGYFQIEDNRIVSFVGHDKQNPTEHTFYASREGTTRIRLGAIHKKTFFTMLSKPVTVTVLKNDDPDLETFTFGGPVRDVPEMASRSFTEGWEIDEER